MRLSVASPASTLSATICARPRARAPSARAVAQSTWRGLFGKKTNPTMSAPASRAASRVAGVERPQILTMGVIPALLSAKAPALSKGWEKIGPGAECSRPTTHRLMPIRIGQGLSAAARTPDRLRSDPAWKYALQDRHELLRQREKPGRIRMNLVRPPQWLGHISSQCAPGVDKVIIVLLHARQPAQHQVEAVDGVLNNREPLRVIVLGEVESRLQPRALEEHSISVRNRIIVAVAEDRRVRSMEIAKVEQRLIRRLDRIDHTLDPARQTPAEIVEIDDELVAHDVVAAAGDEDRIRGSVEPWGVCEVAHVLHLVGEPHGRGHRVAVDRQRESDRARISDRL